MSDYIEDMEKLRSIMLKNHDKIDIELDESEAVDFTLSDMFTDMITKDKLKENAVVAIENYIIETIPVIEQYEAIFFSEEIFIDGWADAVSAYIYDITVPEEGSEEIVNVFNTNQIQHYITMFGFSDYNVKDMIEQIKMAFLVCILFCITKFNFIFSSMQFLFKYVYNKVEKMYIV